MQLISIQSPESLSPEAARIVALFLEGKDASAIVTELTGMTNKNGKPYLMKLAEVQVVTLRQAEAAVAGSVGTKPMESTFEQVAQLEACGRLVRYGRSQHEQEIASALNSACG